jgi:cytochrome P450
LCERSCNGAPKEKREDNIRDVAFHLAEGSSKISKGEYEANLAVLIIAGSESTSMTIAAVIYWLNQPIRCYERRSALHSEEEIHHEVCSNLPYLGAVIKETLRLTPASPAVHSPDAYTTS